MYSIGLSDDFTWSFSSLGNSYIDRQIIKVFHQAGLKNAGVSLLAGQLVNVEKTLFNYQERGINVYSLDLPDFNWNRERFSYDWRMVNKDRPSWWDWQASKWLKYFSILVFQFFVWRLYGGVAREKSFWSKLEAYCRFKVANNEKIVWRWDSRSLREVQANGILYQMNEMLVINNWQATMMIEYFPESHAPEEFLPWWSNVGRNLTKLDLRLSFDGVHYERIVQFYPEWQKVKAEEFWYYYLRNDRLVKRLGMIEISNIGQKSQVAHFDWQGRVDFFNIMMMAGQAYRQGLIEKPLQIVLEISPMILGSFLNSGQLFLEGLLVALNDRDEYMLLAEDIEFRSSYKFLKEKMKE